MFLVLSLKELRLHKALNALSMNWEKFAVRISRQFLKKPVGFCPPWQADLPGFMIPGESSTGGFPPLQVVKCHTGISVTAPGAGFCTEAAYEDNVAFRQPPHQTHTHVCTHTYAHTHAHLVGKLLLAVWRARGLLCHADTSPVQPM